MFNIIILHKDGSVCFLKIWLFCPFFRLNSPEKQGSRDDGQGEKDEEKCSRRKEKEHREISRNILTYLVIIVLQGLIFFIIDIY